MPQVRFRESLNFDIAEGIVDLPSVIKESMPELQYCRKLTK